MTNEEMTVMRRKQPREVLGNSLVLLLLCVPSYASESLCPGNCNGDSSVTVDELVLGVNMALGTVALAECPAFDGEEDGVVSVDELIKGVNAALSGCPGEPSSSPTRSLSQTSTRTGTPTHTPTYTPLPTHTIAYATTPTLTPTTASGRTTTHTATLTPTPSPTQTPTVLRSLGPRITFLGIARADNTLVQSSGTTEDGIPIYERPNNFGFIIVVEGRPGTSGKSLSSFGTVDNPATGSSRSSLQILASNALGNGSSTVCDVGPRPDPIGGVPAENPIDFGPSQGTTDAINDFACRFDFHTPNAPCTLDGLGNFSLASGEVASGTRQYCTAPAVGRELAFPSGDTILTAQLADTGGNLGSPVTIMLRIP
jgi:hypothetical protein